MHMLDWTYYRYTSIRNYVMRNVQRNNA